MVDDDDPTLAQAQRLEALDQVATAFVHELAPPLAVIVQGVSSLRSRFIELTGDAPDEIEYILGATVHLEALAAELRRFTIREPPDQN